MKRLAGLAAIALVLAACGGDGGSSVELGSNATFLGTFETGDGYGPGDVVIMLDEEGTGIVSISLDAGFDGFTCPAGEAEGTVISGGGYTVTLEPAQPLSGDSFDVDGFAGTFTSSTEASGTYDLTADHDCDFTLNWTATTDNAVGS